MDIPAFPPCFPPIPSFRHRNPRNNSGKLGGNRGERIFLVEYTECNAPVKSANRREARTGPLAAHPHFPTKILKNLLTFVPFVCIIIALSNGRLAQLVEHLLDVQGVRDSSSLPSTMHRFCGFPQKRFFLLKTPCRTSGIRRSGRAFAVFSIPGRGPGRWAARPPVRTLGRPPRSSATGPFPPAAADGGAQRSSRRSTARPG